MNELPVVVCKSKERLDVGDVSRRRPVLDGLNLSWVDLDSVGSDDESEELDAFLVEFAFLWCSLEVNCTKPLEHGLYVSDVILKGSSCEDQNVIDVRDDSDV